MTLYDKVSEAGHLLADGDREVEAVENFDDAVLTLLALRDVKRVVAEVFDRLETHALSLMGAKRVEVPGVGLVESKRRTKRTKWDHDDVFRTLTARLADEEVLFLDEDDHPLPRTQVVANVVDRLREALTPSWKVTGLAALGLDSDEFCATQPDGFSLVLPSVKQEQRGAA